MIISTSSRPSAPNPFILRGLRNQLLGAARWSQSLATAMAAPFPAGPITPDLRARLVTAYTSSSIASSAGSGAKSVLDVLRDLVKVPAALDAAIQGMLYSSDSLRRDAGYLHGLVDAGWMPDEGSTYMVAKVRSDAATMQARAAEALIQLNATGWLPPT